MLRLTAFILAVAGLLVGIWFKDGYILGTAEDGIIFYKLSAYLAQAQYSWMEYPGLGSPSMFQTAAKPTYLFLNFLQTNGIPGFIIQALVFWFLLVSAGVGVTLLTKELFPKLEYKYILLGVLLYWLNPVSVANVWNRFLLNYIFFFALLPSLTFLYIRGLKQREYFWAVLLNLSLLVYAYAFSYLAFTILFWFWLIILTVFWVVIYRNFQFSIKFFSLTVALFLILNTWWILPILNLYLTGGVTTTENLFVKQNNPGALDALSKKLGNFTDILSLNNASFLESPLEWVKDFYSPISKIVGYIFFGIILYSLIKLRKEKIIIFLGLLLFSVLFLIKGSNPPFGQVYSFIFEKVTILQIFRNSFEKFGFLLSLVVSVLFSYGLYYLSVKSNNLIKRFVFPIFLFLVVSIGFPLYTTLAFTNTFPPTNDYNIGYKVKVPEYYQEANLWLLSQKGHFRYIGLPLKDEGITYKWEKGYAGLELSHVLFSTPGLMHTTSVPYFNQIVPIIEKTLLSKDDFSLLANVLNVRYYLLREDIDYQGRTMTDPMIIRAALDEREQKGEIRKVGNFGKVTIWENLRWQDYLFYPAKRILSSDPTDPRVLAKIDVRKDNVLIEQKGIQSLEERQEIFLEYRKIDPTSYKVKIKNVSGPFILVFSELFNNGWQASYQDGKILNKHIRANLYGNGWIIDRNGNFDIIVKFIPQRWMELGEKISITGYVVMTLLLSFSLSSFKRGI